MNIPEFGLLSYNNVPTGGIFGFVNTLKSIIPNVPKDDTKFITVWDGKRSRRRLSVYPDYKQNRNRLHDEDYSDYMANFQIQQKLLREKFLPALGVCNITNVDREADDVIHLICSLYHLDADKIFVISEDKDMFQLVHHFGNVTIFRPIAKQTVNLQNFKDEVLVEPRQFLIYKALKGDKSDNIKGIPLIGPKTAQKILNKGQPRDSSEFFDWIHAEHKKEAEKGRETRVSGIYKQWGVFTRNLELMDMSREEFTNHEQVAVANAIDAHITRYYEDYFLKLCSDYGLQQFINEKLLWKRMFEL